MLTRRTLALALALAVAVVLAGAGIASADGTGVSCPNGLCGVGATDGGKPGGGGGKGTQPIGSDDGGSDPGGNSSGSGSSGSTGGGSGGGSTGPVSNAGAGCSWKNYSPQPAAGSPLWGGNDPSAGVVQYYSCPGAQAQGLNFGDRFLPNAAPAVPGAPPAPPPPNPAELAAEAYQQIPIPNPEMNFGPNDEQIAVRYWLYLWTNDPGEISRTVTAGGVSVTATAKLTSVTWSMGAPASVDQLGGRGETVTCAGAGKPAPVNADVVNDPRPAGYCAYMYQVRSTFERTGGSQSWPVTATATWTISWVANTGETGVITAPPFTSATAVCVGAWSTVNVADSYTPPVGRCSA